MSALIDTFRTGKSYSIREVAAYAGTSGATVRRWLFGYHTPGHHMEPVFADKSVAPDTPSLSFLDLAEIVVAVTFTKHGGKLAKVRRARERALLEYPELQYPFANLKLKQLGGEILHAVDDEMGGKALAISLGSPGEDQFTLPGFAQEALDLFDFDRENNLAERWYPAGKDVPIVVDPRFGGGRLTIVGRSVTVDLIRRMFYDQRFDMGFIAEDLDLDRETIEQVLKIPA